MKNSKDVYLKQIIAATMFLHSASKVLSLTEQKDGSFTADILVKLPGHKAYPKTVTMAKKDIEVAYKAMQLFANL